MPNLNRVGTIPYQKPLVNMSPAGINCPFSASLTCTLRLGVKSVTTFENILLKYKQYISEIEVNSGSVKL